MSHDKNYSKPRINSRLSKNNQFVPGIYNYCDRWCERCLMTGKCSLYYEEQKTKAEHLAKGEDPHDWNIIMQDIKKNFEEALKLLEKSAAEQGIDLNSLPDEPCEEPHPNLHPLNLRARNYMLLAHRFLEKLHKTLKTDTVNMKQRAKTMLLPNDDENVQTLEILTSHYSAISWYYTLILSKIHRALSSKMMVEIEKDEELMQTHKDDADGSAKVAYDGIIKSIAAFQKFYEWDEGLQDEALELMIEADRLRKAIDKEFPGHQNFKRPGFEW